MLTKYRVSSCTPKANKKFYYSYVLENVDKIKDYNFMKVKNLHFIMIIFIFFEAFLTLYINY